MATAQSRPASTFVHVLRADRELPPEQQSRFTLRAMTIAERAATRDNLTRVQLRDGERTITSRSRQIAVELALSHLVSIENFPAGDPKPWPVDGSLADRIAYLELLGDDYVSELGNAVFDHASPASAGGAAKNS